MKYYQVDGRTFAVIDGELWVKATTIDEPAVTKVRDYKKRVPKHFAKTTLGGKLNWKSLNKLRELKAGGMTSKDAADEIGKSLELANTAWGSL